MTPPHPKPKGSFSDPLPDTRDYFHNNPNPMFVYDVEDLRILAANGAALTQYGYSEPEFLGLTIREIRPVEDIPVLDRVLAEMRQQGTGPHHVEESIRHRRKDGTVFHVEIRSHPLAYSGHKARLVTVLDISERVQARQALVEKEERLRELFNEASDGIITFDRQGTVQAVNSTLLELTQYRENELIGRNMASLVHPDDLASQPIAWDRLERGERVLSVRRLLNKNGQYVTMEISSRMLSNGTVQAILRDVNQRLEMERVIRRAESRWRSVIEGGSEGYVIVGADGLVQDFNRVAATELQDLFGVGLETGEPLPERIESSFRETFLGLFGAALEGRAQRIERKFKHGGKGPTWYEFTFSSVRDDSRKVVAVCLAILCIDERRKAEEAVQQRIEFEQLMTNLSTRFINLPSRDIDDGIRETLQTLAEHVQADGCWILMKDEDPAYVSETHEWLAPGIPSHHEKLQHVPLFAFPWMSQQAEQGVPIRLDRMADIPTAATTERDFLKETGVKAWLAVPIRHGGHLVGLVGFDDHRGERAWSEDAVSVLRVAGEMFINAIGRKRMEEALRDSEAALRAVFDGGQYGITLVGPDYRIRTVNRRMQEIAQLYTGGAIQAGQSVFEFHPRGKETEYRTLLDGVMEGKPHRAEITATGTDGILHWFEMTLSPVRDDQSVVIGICLMLLMVDERKRIEAAVKESEEKFKLLFNSARDFIYLNELEEDGSLGRFVEVNEVVCHRLGRTRPELLERSFRDLLWGENAVMPENTRLELLETGATTFETVHVSRTGIHLPLEVGSRVILWDNRKMVLSIARDVTERKRAEETIRRQAYYDPLTSLPNRALLKDRLSQAMAQTRRSKQSLAVLILDLDRFKTINETLGHVVGDELLVGVAERLLSTIQEGETIARLGGDEFCILLPQLVNPEDAVGPAKKVIDAFHEPFHLQGHELHVTPSVGIAIYPVDGEESEVLLKNAETAMYRAKEQGRNNYQMYASIMNATAFKKLLMENNLRRGVERREFIVHYQPILELKTRRIVGIEALARWQHPDLKLIFPSEFIPLAEETGLIVPMGEHVIGMACHETQQWRKMGYPDLYVAVNLSGRQFQHPSLKESLARILWETGLPPQNFLLEITETIAMKNADATVTLLEELTKTGGRLALDDFGIGYSSLSYLKRFPIHTLKVDQSFVRDINTDPNDAAIVTAVIAMAHSLKLLVVAEGVETEAQMEFLRKQGCDMVQGYLVSHPLPADEFELLLKAGNGQL